MKENIHPVYREVVFQDTSANFSFISRSTIAAKETIVWEDGKEYPLVRLDISSASHPFFTGKQRLVDAEGRVERFMKKYQKTADANQQKSEASTKASGKKK